MLYWKADVVPTTTEWLRNGGRVLLEKYGYGNQTGTIYIFEEDKFNEFELEAETIPGWEMHPIVDEAIETPDAEFLLQRWGW